MLIYLNNWNYINLRTIKQNCDVARKYGQNCMYIAVMSCVPFHAPTNISKLHVQ